MEFESLPGGTVSDRFRWASNSMGLDRHRSARHRTCRLVPGLLSFGIEYLQIVGQELMLRVRITNADRETEAVLREAGHLQWGETLADAPNDWRCSRRDLILCRFMKCEGEGYKRGCIRLELGKLK